MMKELEFGEEMMVEMSEIGISKDACIRHELFMGDLGGGPIFDGPIGPKELSTSFIFVFLTLSPFLLCFC